jgi:hypothetical protein
MSQVISIRFAQNALPHAADFLRAWEQIGSWKQIAGQRYELRARTGDVLLLAGAEAELQITGHPQDDTCSFIKAFAARAGGELLFEGEVLGKNEVAQSEVLEGELIRGEPGRTEKNHTDPLRSWGMHGGQAVFRQFSLKPAPKAILIPAALIFLPLALAVMLLIMMAMFGRLAFHMLRLSRRG